MSEYLNYLYILPLSEGHLKNPLKSSKNCIMEDVVPTNKPSEMLVLHLVEEKLPDTTTTGDSASRAQIFRVIRDCSQQSAIDDALGFTH